MRKNYDIFISYSKHDWLKVQIIRNLLEANGISTWLDTSRLSTGYPIGHEIEQGLLMSKYVIVFWSPRSIRSAWVIAESMKAYEKRKLIPVLLEPVEIPIPFNIANTYDLTKWMGGAVEPSLIAFLQWLLPAFIQQQVGISIPTPLSDDKKKEYHIIRAPLYGEFLRSDRHQSEATGWDGDIVLCYNPDAEPLIKVGDSVKKNQGLGVIWWGIGFEEVCSDIDGVLESILVEDRQYVEIEQPLFRVNYT
jgi:biotin carboxyl carrier protein